MKILLSNSNDSSYESKTYTRAIIDNAGHTALPYNSKFEGKTTYECCDILIVVPPVNSRSYNDFYVGAGQASIVKKWITTRPKSLVFVVHRASPTGQLYLAQMVDFTVINNSWDKGMNIQTNLDQWKNPNGTAIGVELRDVVKQWASRQANMPTTPSAIADPVQIVETKGIAPSKPTITLVKPMLACSRRR